ncbi:hypothetical protein [Streptomyces stelliscabiei]|uniref:hypothetical protein n=1 Tax=Streptomyces stelliscabiei TaxID=146820 RepID=UPI002FF269A5
MKIAPGNVINMTTAAPGWHFAFDLGEGAEIVCPLIGWATVVEAHMNDGTATTRVEPAFVWSQQVWTLSALREHAPTLDAYDIRDSEPRSRGFVRA